VCKLQNNCSCLTCKHDPSSDHTGKDPSEDRNRNCRQTCGIPTRKGDKRPNLTIQVHKACEHQQPLYICALSTSRRHSTWISHDKLWVTMMDTGYPLHLTDLLAKLYRKQHAKVKVANNHNGFMLRKESDMVVSFPCTCSTS